MTLAALPSIRKANRSQNQNEKKGKRKKIRISKKAHHQAPSDLSHGVSGYEKPGSPDFCFEADSNSRPRAGRASVVVVVVAAPPPVPIRPFGQSEEEGVVLLESTMVQPVYIAQADAVDNRAMARRWTNTTPSGRGNLSRRASIAGSLPRIHLDPQTAAISSLQFSLVVSPSHMLAQRGVGHS